jgi:hypothetical protein
MAGPSKHSRPLGPDVATLREIVERQRKEQEALKAKHRAELRSAGSGVPECLFPPISTHPPGSIQQPKTIEQQLSPATTNKTPRKHIEVIDLTGTPTPPPPPVFGTPEWASPVIGTPKSRERQSAVTDTTPQTATTPTPVPSSRKSTLLPLLPFF